ncbi:MAG: glycine betaine ABC transporter substrate-binding protein [Comamonas sp.]
MKFAQRLVAATLAAWCLLVSGLAAAQNLQADTLRVGSKRFTESYVLAQIVAQSAQAAGAKVQVRQGLGNTAIVYEALRSGQIDVYAEYTGTIAQEIVKDPSHSSLADLNKALAPMGLAVGVPLGFNNGYALAMRRDKAEQLGIRSLSDLAQHSDLRYGLSNEFVGRADGWPGLAARYQLHSKPQGLDHGLAYEAIAQQQIDVMDIYTTDAKIDALSLLVLQDDRNYFPHYDAVLLYRADLPNKQPAAWAALQPLQGRIGEAAMIQMNAQAELHSQPFEVIAREFLAQGPGASTAAVPQAKASFGQQLWQRLWADDLWRLTGQHLLLVLLSVGAATLIAVPLGVLLFPHTRLRALAVGAAGVMQTIPSLALLAVLIALLGVIGRLPALLALTAYSILPILSNTCAGLAEVSPGLRSAGAALGMTRPQRMRWVELPIAMPTVIAGIRTACAIAIGTATIAAFIGAGGLGERIVTGLALNDSALMLAGALPAAALALMSELLFELLDRYLRRKREKR